MKNPTCIKAPQRVVQNVWQLNLTHILQPHKHNQKKHHISQHMMSLLFKSSGLRSELSRRCGALVATRSITKVSTRTKPPCGLFSTKGEIPLKCYTTHICLKRADIDRGCGGETQPSKVLVETVEIKEISQNDAPLVNQRITFPLCDDDKEFSVDGVSTNGKFHSDPSFFQRLLWEQNQCEYHGDTRNNKPHDNGICSLVVTNKFKFKGSFSNGKFDHNGCLSLYCEETEEYLMSAIGKWDQGSLLYGMILNGDGNAVAYVSNSIVHGCDGKVLFGADHPDISNYSVIVKTANAYAIANNTKPSEPMPLYDGFKRIQNPKNRLFFEMLSKDFLLVMAYMYSNHFEVSHIYVPSTKTLRVYIHVYVIVIQVSFFV
jgi:hypothetical protein